MKKVSVVIAGRHSTSVCLEEEFLYELKRIALIKKMSLNALITLIDRNKHSDNLSSAIRVWVLNEIKNS